MTAVKDVVQALGIGASDIAAILGISPFGNPWTVYARKKGLLGPPVQTDEMEWGKILEPVIAGKFSLRMDLPIEWWDKRIYSKKRPWQYASPDALILTEPQQVLEVKTAGLSKAAEWSRERGDAEGIPEYYRVQVEWQLSTLELETAYVAVLIAGSDFRIYKIRHDPLLEEILLEEVEEFWRQHLLAGVEPPMGGSRQAREYLKKQYPRERENLRPATAEEITWLSEYGTVRTKLDALEGRKAELENQLFRAIGNHEGLEWPSGKMTWKKTKDSHATDWELLALKQLEGYSNEEQQNFIEEYTHTVAGYRKIYFKERANANA